jgi:hypothetical protein
MFDRVRDSLKGGGGRTELGQTPQPGEVPTMIGVTDAILGAIRDRVAVDDRRLADPAVALEEVAQG